MKIRTKWFDAINLFCMHIIDIQIEGESGTLKIPLRASSFGRYAVVILDVQEFIRRLKKAVNKAGYSLSHSPVKYYNPAIGIHTNLATLEPIFTKRDDYQEEQEYRIAIDRGLAVPTPLKLEIGSIHDIARSLCWEAR